MSIIDLASRRLGPASAADALSAQALPDFVPCGDPGEACLVLWPCPSEPGFLLTRFDHGMETAGIRFNTEREARLAALACNRLCRIDVEVQQ